jgi:hypothetical protein
LTIQDDAITRAKSVADHEEAVYQAKLLMELKDLRDRALQFSHEAARKQTFWVTQYHIACANVIAHEKRMLRQTSLEV